MFPIPKQVKRKAVNQVRKLRSVMESEASSHHSAKTSASQLIHSLSTPKNRLMTLLPGSAFAFRSVDCMEIPIEIPEEKYSDFSNAVRSTGKRQLTTKLTEIAEMTESTKHTRKSTRTLTQTNDLNGFKSSTKINEIDIHAISDNGNLTPPVIDAYFSIVKQLNRKSILANKAVDKVLMYSTSIANKIFENQTHPLMRINLFRYDVLFFPIKRPGFWALLSVNLEGKTVSIYNPTDNPIEKETILLSLFNFLSKEFTKYFASSIQQSSYRNLNYKEVRSEKFSDDDSGVFMCKHVETIAAGRIFKVDASNCYEYRNDILEKVLKFT